jgi:hypothetical protein
VTSVNLTQVTTPSGVAYVGDPIQFRADVAPDDAQKRYNFRLIVDGKLGFELTSAKDPLTFHHAFATAGTHTVQIAVWNCRMLEAQAVKDSVEIMVLPRPVRLPLILKN